MVRVAGLEPARVAPLPPQSSVSANSTIRANWIANEAVRLHSRKPILVRGKSIFPLPKHVVVGYFGRDGIDFSAHDDILKRSRNPVNAEASIFHRGFFVSPPPRFPWNKCRSG